METNKYTEFCHSKKTVQGQIEMSDASGKPFIATLYNVILALDLCDWLFTIIKLIKFGTYLSL